MLLDGEGHILPFRTVIYTISTNILSIYIPVFQAFFHLFISTITFRVFSLLGTMCNFNKFKSITHQRLIVSKGYLIYMSELRKFRFS